MNQLSVILAEESFLIRKGLKTIIEDLSDFKLIRDFDSADNLMEEIRNLNPDLLVISSDFLNKDICERIHHEMNHTDLKIVELVKSKPYGDSNRLQLDLNSEKRIILNLFKEIAGKKEFKESRKLKPWELSAREETVVKYIALGKTNKEIADNLFLSPHTIITHRKNISRKLGIKSASGITVYAILNKLIDPEELA